MRTGVRWPFLVLLAVVLIAAAGRVWWIWHELSTKPGLAYDQDRVLLPRFLSPAAGQDRAARRAFREGYAAWQKAKPALAQKPGTPLTAEVCRQWTELLTAQLLDAWQRAGGKTGRTADAEALLRARAALLGAAPDRELLGLARRVATAGLGDPLVLAVAGDVLRRNRDSEAAPPWSGQRVSLPTGVYPPRLTSWITGAAAPGDITTDTLVEALRGPFQPGEQRLVNEMRGAFVPSGQLADKAGIDPWLFHLMAGREQVTAVQMRYSGRDGDEPPEVQARRHLLAAWRLHPDWPEAATAMITVAALKPSLPDEPRFWFDQAVAAQFDYPPAYDAFRAAQAEPSRLLAFGRECLATARLDTDVPDQVWQTLVAAAQLEDKDIAVNWADAGSYDALHRLFAKRIEQAGDEAETARARARWAAVAYRLDQPADLRLALNGADGGEFEKVGPLAASTAAEWAATRLALGTAEAEADRAWRERRWAEAAGAYEVLATRADDLAARYTRRRAAAARTMASMARGESVVIQPGSDLGCWEVVRGVVLPLADGAVRLSAATGVELRFAAPLHTPFKLSGWYRLPGPVSSVRPALLLRRRADLYPNQPVSLGSTWPDRTGSWRRFELTQTAIGQSTNNGGTRRGPGAGAEGQVADHDRWLALASPELPRLYDPVDSSSAATTKVSAQTWHHPPPDTVWWDLRDLTLGPADAEPAK